MAVPGRGQFLAFDGRDGGRSVEVVGELSTARRVAVLVPGAGIGLDAYGRLRRGAVALQRELGDGGAVVASLGYRSPATVSPASLTEGRATEAAPGLRALVDGLSATLPGAPGHAALPLLRFGDLRPLRRLPGLRPTPSSCTAAPGPAPETVASLRTDARVWARS
ncbi:Alpha/beta hydrolase OS=Streptomyces cyaneofuscatus OX=66883 GN=G3I52_22670 PE=4 SV=1 [Streptomyces cyaneofuscatus]